MRRPNIRLGVFLLLLCGAAQAQTEQGLPTTYAGPDVALAQAAGSILDLPPIVGAPVLCTDNRAAPFPCDNVDLLSFLPITSIGGRNDTLRRTQLNDLWGWTDALTGKEYALVGRTDGVSFVDISDPVRPVYVGDLPLTPGARPTAWRDLKVYENYLFVVADNAGDHGMQVFDLTQLRNVVGPPATFSATRLYDEIRYAHNVAVNEATGFAYVVGSNTCGGALHMIDVRDPLAPVFAGCAADTTTGLRGTGYTHDVQCVVYRGPDAEHSGREICFGANETAISILDVTDKAAPAFLASASYPDRGYVHQGWLTEDHRYFFQGDELDERSGIPTRTIIWDVTDLDDPRVLAQFFNSTTAIDHNLYIAGDHVFQANYTTGLRILDISDVARPREVGYFDTHPDADTPGFQGAWSTYPFFTSGVVIVSSIGEGLFVLRPDARVVHTGVEGGDVPAQFTLAPAYPNPFNPQTTLLLTVAVPQPVRVAVYDVLGRQVAVLQEGLLAAGTYRFSFEGGALPGGVYWVRADGSTHMAAQAVTLIK